MVIAHRAAEILAALRQAPEAGSPGLVLHAALLAVQAASEPAVAPPALAPGEAARRLAAGVPLVPRPFDAGDAASPALTGLVERLAAVTAAHRPDLAGGLAAGPAAMPAGVRAFLLLQATRALLRPVAVALAPLVDDTRWLRGVCPVCGGEPDMAALEPGDGRRRLLCQECDAEWGFQRLGCPFCGLADPAGLAYHEAGAWRLYVCLGCSRYLKTADRRERPAGCLPVERIVSEALDWSALEAGYRGAAPRPAPAP